MRFVARLALVLTLLAGISVPAEAQLGGLLQQGIGAARNKIAKSKEKKKEKERAEAQARAQEQAAAEAAAREQAAAADLAQNGIAVTLCKTKALLGRYFPQERKYVAADGNTYF